MTRKIEYIVVHCTATQPDTKIENIKKYWKEVLHWNNPGYHYIVRRDGVIIPILSEDKVANGVAGYNAQSIHISYIGGVDKEGKPCDNRTPQQQSALFEKLVELSEKYPGAKIQGHRDFPGVKKACPSFDVKTWLAAYQPDLGEGQAEQEEE
jgi:N-acetylmuramoyl-L-alanine amidase